MKDIEEERGSLSVGFLFKYLSDNGELSDPVRLRNYKGLVKKLILFKKV